MTGSTHFITGSAIGKLSGNPILATILGFLFHFVMDMVPHWDYGYHFKKRTISFIIAALEPFLGVMVVLWIVINRDFSQTAIINTLIGGVFCVLPDAMSVFIKFFKIKPLSFFLKIHKKCHWFIKVPDSPFEWQEIKTTPWGVFWGIFWQIPFIVIPMIILMR